MTDDPAASSFAKAMKRSIGTVTIIDENGEVFNRIWCALAVRPVPHYDTRSTHTASTFSGMQAH